jgi:hypothetical protein
MDKRCPHCEEPLVEIDHSGDCLIGCVTCNCWMAEDKVLMQTGIYNQRSPRAVVERRGF